MARAHGRRWKFSMNTRRQKKGCSPPFPDGARCWNRSFPPVRKKAARLWLSATRFRRCAKGGGGSGRTGTHPFRAGAAGAVDAAGCAAAVCRNGENHRVIGTLPGTFTTEELYAALNAQEWAFDAEVLSASAEQTCISALSEGNRRKKWNRRCARWASPAAGTWRRDRQEEYAALEKAQDGGPSNRRTKSAKSWPGWRSIVNRSR